MNIVDGTRPYSIPDKYLQKTNKIHVKYPDDVNTTWFAVYYMGQLITSEILCVLNTYAMRPRTQQEFGKHLHDQLTFIGFVSLNKDYTHDKSVVNQRLISENEL